MTEMRHIPGMDSVNYLGRYCYPEFSTRFTVATWKRKIAAYRERILSNGAVVPEVRVWRTFWYEWVPTRDISFIWNLMEDDK